MDRHENQAKGDLASPENQAKSLKENKAPLNITSQDQYKFMNKNIAHLMYEFELEKSRAFNVTQVELDDRLVQKEKATQLKKEAENLREELRKQRKFSALLVCFRFVVNAVKHDDHISLISASACGDGSNMYRERERSNSQQLNNFLLRHNHRKKTLFNTLQTQQ